MEGMQFLDSSRPGLGENAPFLFLLLSEEGSPGGNGGRVDECLPGNHSPAQKLTV